MKIKNLFNLFLLTSVLFLTSCYMTSEVVWGNKFYDETFKGFTISEDEKVILVGEKFYYLIDEPTGNFKKFLEWQQDSKVAFRLGDSYVETTGSKLGKWIIVVVQTADLTKQQIKFVESIDFKHVQTSRLNYFDLDKNFTGTRFLPDPKTNYKISLFNKPQEKPLIKENHTPLKKTAKLLITPVAIAIDIITLPADLVRFVYQKLKVIYIEKNS